MAIPALPSSPTPSLGLTGGAGGSARTGQAAFGDAIDAKVITVGAAAQNVGEILKQFVGPEANGGFGASVSRLVAAKLGSKTSALLPTTNGFPTTFLIVGGLIAGGSILWFLSRKR